MIVEMSRLRLAGMKSDYDGVIDILTKSKQLEFRTAADTQPLDEDEIASAKTEQAKISFAIDYLNKLNDEATALLARIKKGKSDRKLDYTPFKKEGVRKMIDFESFVSVENRKDEIMKTVDALTELSFKQVELRTRIAQTREKKNEFKPLSGLPLRFDELTDTELTVSALYFSKKNILPPDLSDNIYCKLYEVSGGFAAAVICFKSDFDDVSSAFSKLGFSKVGFTGGTADEQMAQCDADILALEEELFGVMLDGLKFENSLLDLMIYYDLLGIRLQQKTALAGSITTTYTFILDGWVPRAAAEAIVKEIDEKYDICYSLTDAKPEDDPPTLVRNNGLVEPFENITKMYTVPAYTEKDPNPHMAFWYFLLFGVMCGDVVYGFMLTLGCIVLLKIKKFEKGTASLIKMFAICGVSSLLWGVAFDSYLGYSIGFGWFSPMDKPMMLLGLSLVLGVLQIAYGYILGVIRCIRQRDAMGAIFDMGLMLVVIVAIVLLAANIFTGIFTEGIFDMSGHFLPDNIASLFSKIGLILLLAAIVGIFLTAGRASKSIAGKLGNGLYGVYGLVNLVSDILSYCRLFGLGLAGGAIAYAFNTLMETIFFSGGSIVGFAIGAILSLVLHVFNLAISLLGAYVHNARLQMLEFYGKFLIGDGREFSYIGENTKYVIYQ